MRKKKFFYTIAILYVQLTLLFLIFFMNNYYKDRTGFPFLKLTSSGFHVFFVFRYITFNPKVIVRIIFYNR